MPITDTFEGVSEPDVAGLTVGGLSYRCNVYLRPEVNRVEAIITRCNPDGGWDLVDHSIVRTGEDAEVPVDCPKVIAVGSTFVAHWIEAGAEAGGLFRSLFDMTAIADGWDSQGFTVIFESMLYDVDPVTGGDGTEFVVAWKSDTDEISVGRYESPYAWVDQVWIDTFDVGVLNCMSVACDDGVNTCVVTREVDPEGSDAQLWTLRFDADDPTSGIADVETMPDVVADFNHYLSCPQVLATSANRWVVVAEFVTNVNASEITYHGHVRGVCWTVINGATAAPVCDSQWREGVSLASRPWTWTSGFATGAPEVYCLVLYHTLSRDIPWGFSGGYFVALDYAATLTATNPGTVSPILCGSIVDGSIDGRPAGRSPDSSSEPANAIDTRRTNHPSHVVGPPQYELGPEVASVCVASLVFERLLLSARFVSGDAVGNALYPVNAGVRNYVHHHEAPWTYRRDAKQPAAPDDQNMKACVPWTPAQSVDIGPAIVFSGGTPHVYAGEQLVELGFVYPPEIIAIEDGNNGANAEFGPGLYWYAVTFTWPDEHGQLHRSGPSTPVSFDHGGTGTPSPDLVLRTMVLSAKDNTTHYPLTRPITIEVWRTYLENGQPAFDPDVGPAGVYLLRRVWSSPDSSDPQPLRETPINDPTTWQVTVHDDQGDDVVSVSDLLPWQLDTTTLQWATPPPVPVPALDVVSRWDNRLVGAKGSRFYYSEQIGQLGTQFVMPEFNDINTFLLDGDGDLTLCEVSDNHLVLATRTSIVTLVGEGAQGGVGATLQRQVVSQGIGCMEPRSVVNVPGVGVFFQADQGYHLFNKGLQVQYLEGGAAVEDLIREAGNVRSAEHLANRHQIRVELNGQPQQVTQIDALFGGVPQNGNYVLSFTHNDLPTAVSVIVPRVGNVPNTNAQLATAMAVAVEASDDLVGLVASATGVDETCEIVTAPGVVGLAIGESAPGTGTITIGADQELDPVIVPRVLIYDYLFQQWSEIPFVELGSASVVRLNEQIDGTVWRGRSGEALHVVLQTGGLAVERESSDLTFADTTHTSTVGVCIDVTLEWLHLDGIAGIVRTREVGVSTRRINPGEMATQVWADMDGSFSLLATAVSETKEWDSPAPAYLPFRIRRQKASAMMIRVYEPTNTDMVEGLAIQGLSLEVGAKSKLRRTAASQKGQSA